MVSTKSKIYRGHILHARLSPVGHSWRFPFYFYALDVDELPDLDRTLFGFGYNRWRPVRLKEADYLRGTGGFRKQLSEFVDTSRAKRIVMITVARFLRRTFNPVSFYYGFDDGDRPCWMVVEVNNTFGERHVYVMDELGTEPNFPLDVTRAKQFHVSPFNNMEGEYHFSFSAPAENMRITIQLVRDGERIMLAEQTGTSRPLTSRNLWLTLARYPFTAALIMPRILWQAARLRFQKKLPVFRKPSPHSSMTIRSKS